ncbi:MAG TPA: hypothetical protein ENK17_03355 [Anaerolineae bacterium]|nr:hypothetical protein [Anaerolineae bacterium]
MGKNIALVVDTDVVRAASGSSSAQYARLCATILEGIRDGEFVLAMSDPLREEWLSPRGSGTGWDYYISLYAYTWWSDLKNRGMVRTYELDQRKGEQILSGFRDQDIRSKVQKDLHIVLTALCADNRLISGNRRERGHFRDACRWAAFLRRMLWPWPLETVPDWLAQGADVVADYLLCGPVPARETDY